LISKEFFAFAISDQGAIIASFPLLGKCLANLFSSNACEMNNLCIRDSFFLYGNHLLDNEGDYHLHFQLHIHHACKTSLFAGISFSVVMGVIACSASCHA